MGSCRQCGKEGVRNGRYYCSKECCAASQRLPDVICKNPKCNKLFRRAKGTQMFCSKHCSDTAGKGRIPEELRMRVIALRTERKSISEISQTMHITEHAVKAITKRARITISAPKGRPRTRASSVKTHASLAKARREDLHPALRHVLHERLAVGTEPLPPMHPISWGAIAL